MIKSVLKASLVAALGTVIFSAALSYLAPRLWLLIFKPFPKVWAARN